MINIKNIESITHHVTWNKEKLIEVNDLINVLQDDSTHQVKIDNCIITPFYIAADRIMELYQYEYTLLSGCDFEDYILRKTGKGNIENIPGNELDLRKRCFSNVMDRQNICSYLQYIKSSSELIKEVKEAFGDYCESYLYVTIY